MFPEDNGQDDIVTGDLPNNTHNTTRPAGLEDSGILTSACRDPFQLNENKAQGIRSINCRSNLVMLLHTGQTLSTMFFLLDGIVAATRSLYFK